MNRFNVRVYGILLNDRKQVLVSDEWIRGMYISKFCGGGLEYGEGTRDCLIREFIEEMRLRVAVEEHIYTTDYFQPSAFHPEQQIISIYYQVRALEAIQIPLQQVPFTFTPDQLKQYELTGETESFRWIDWEDFSEDSVTLPIDKKVARIIKERY
ncbi:MAG TPA: NUDIX domain-containing protein [Ferruginibacter sp.]|nr:NUDIX domain-containing protein [Ferruginibacter sp.]HRO06672.1 NUDIX domain-containing protein [Ferruginibacter sp.]HRO96329.1 NUDIX domain-containing protein [Ferruginibacter sp.]HRP48434.1 NUDIX domain-containing protein [Ferruginibacter sp.]